MRQKYNIEKEDVLDILTTDYVPIIKIMELLNLPNSDDAEIELENILVELEEMGEIEYKNDDAMDYYRLYNED